MSYHLCCSLAGEMLIDSTKFDYCFFNIKKIYLKFLLIRFLLVLVPNA